MISNGAAFSLNGRRALLAPTDGTLAYDGAGSSSFTATFSGLSSADVNRALGGEMVVNWLGRAPLVGNELTIFENGPGTDGGPAAGACTAPLDPTAPLIALSPTARVAFGDQSAAPASTSPARSVVVSNAGSGPLTLSSAYVGGQNPGDFAITSPPLPPSIPSGGSVTVSVTFSPKAVGTRSATLNVVSNGANTSYQTLDLTGTGTDSAAPSAVTGLTRTLVPDQTIADTVPVQIGWTASTGTTTRYEVQQSLSGGAFTDLPAGEQPTAGSTSILRQVIPATATRYRVRACNGPNCSAYTTLAAFTLVAFQENNKSVSTSGTWVRSALAGAFGGSVSSSSTARNGATLKTTGTGFEVISTLGPDRGNTEVWLDGTRVGTVNLYAPSVRPARSIFTREGLANATHQVELRALGTRTAPSTGNRVDIDGFIAVR